MSETFKGTKVLENMYGLSSYFYVKDSIDSIIERINRNDEFLTVEIVESQRYTNRDGNSEFKIKTFKATLNKMCFKCMRNVEIYNEFNYLMEKDL